MKKRLMNIGKGLAVLCLLLLALPVAAQRYMYVWQGGNFTRVDRSTVGDMPFSGGGYYLQIDGVSYPVSRLDSITFTPPVLDTTGKVVVRYEGNRAEVSIPASVSGVTAQVNGAHVILTSTNTTDELEYVLQGTSSAGSLLYYGDYKCKFYLNNLNLVSNKGAAIDIQCGKRIEMILHEGTVNSLQDAPGGVQKAALNCDGHLEFEDGGSLTVAGKTGHAIRSNEYLLIKKSTGTVAVTEAVKDGLHCGQYFQMNGGNLVVAGNKEDAVQAELTNNPLDELNGQLLVKGGTLQLSVTGNDVKGLKADKNITISGGDIRIKVTGNGSKGISTDGHLFVNENDNPTNIDIEATGGPYTDPTTQEVKKCMGMKIDFNMTVESGKIKVVNTGKDSSGIKVAGTYTNKGGQVDASIEAGVMK